MASTDLGLIAVANDVPFFVFAAAAALEELLDDELVEEPELEPELLVPELEEEEEEEFTPETPPETPPGARLAVAALASVL